MLAHLWLTGRHLYLEGQLTHRFRGVKVWARKESPSQRGVEARRVRMT